MFLCIMPYYLSFNLLDPNAEAIQADQLTKVQYIEHNSVFTYCY